MSQDVNLKYISFLSIVAALGGFLFGYDTAVISGTITQVSIQFGLDTISQGWYVGCALIGSILGVSVAGVLSDTVGRTILYILSRLCTECHHRAARILSHNRRYRYRSGIYRIATLHIRGIGSRIPWAYGCFVSVGYHHRIFRSIPGQLRSSALL